MKRPPGRRHRSTSRTTEAKSATSVWKNMPSARAAGHDRRIKTAALTPEGHRVVQAINQGRRRLLEEAFAGWSERDQADLARLTRRFSDEMFALIEAHDHGSPT